MRREHVVRRVRRGSRHTSRAEGRVICRRPWSSTALAYAPEGSSSASAAGPESDSTSLAPGHEHRPRRVDEDRLHDETTRGKGSASRGRRSDGRVRAADPMDMRQQIARTSKIIHQGEPPQGGPRKGEDEHSRKWLNMGIRERLHHAGHLPVQATRDRTRTRGPFGQAREQHRRCGRFVRRLEAKGFQAASHCSGDGYSCNRD